MKFSMTFFGFNITGSSNISFYSRRVVTEKEEQC